MTDILQAIEADIRRRKAHQAQQIAISQNAKAREQKWAALIAQQAARPIGSADTFQG